MRKTWTAWLGRMGLNWLVVAVLPFLVLWWQYIVADQLEPPQINSLSVVTIGIVINHYVLHHINSFPGQRSLTVLLPILLMIVVVIGAVLLVFRIPYSVYQLSASFVLGVGYFVIAHYDVSQKYQPPIGYLPLGRGIEFRGLGQHNFFELQTPHVPKPVKAIVADLSSQELDETWQRFLALQAIQGIPVYNYLQVYESLTGRSPIQYLYENDLGALQPSQGFSIIKRWCDISIVVLSLPIVLPMMLLVALMIQLESEGKAIFIQQRVGQGGKVFKMYKFRSMYTHAPQQNQLMTQANDQRITRVGRWLRQWRIDELPQFYNVIRGDMSLIGPRPELPEMVTMLDQQIPFYIYRQIVKPGISGWAQVMQGDGHVENIQIKLEYDFYYIKNFSFTLDFLIVIKTIQTMLTGFGAR